ncbi:MAG: glycosyltransferase family 39 protein [Candidatus Omnitrophota bacterium]
MKRSLPAHYKYLLLSIAIGLLFSSIIISFNINKPFNLDEQEFACAAHNVIIKGIPLIEVDETYSERYEGQPLGLWHPPLYIYTLSLAFKILGESVLTARGLGFLFHLVTFIFFILICGKLFKDKEFYIVSSIAAIFYCINPIITQYTLLIDIDGGMLLLGMIGFSYFFISLDERKLSPKNIFFLGSLFGILLLIKFTTPPLIIPAMFTFYILQRRYKEAFLNPFLILIVGISVAWVIWYIYCRIFNMPLFYPMEYTFKTKFHQGGIFLTKEKLMGITFSFLSSLCWLSPWFMALMSFSIIYRISRFIRQKALEGVDFLLILGIVILLFYFYYFPRGLMMKYQTIMYPLFIIVFSKCLYDLLLKHDLFKRKDRIVCFVLAISAFLYYFLFFPDMVLWFTRGMSAAKGIFQENQALFNILYFSPLIILSILFYFLSSKKNIVSSLIIGVSLLTFGAQVNQDIKQTADYTTANSWNNYGERGERETIDYLNSNLPKDGVVIVRKDIGYYLKTYPSGASNRKWIYNEIFTILRPQKAQARFQRLMEEYDISYIQLDAVYSRGYDIIKPYFVFDKRFDDFVIFKRR